jgi:RNA polymerase sigma factor (sigma-70 family)
MVGSVGVAEELVHDGFIRLHRNWDRVEHPRAFLRVAVVNLCLSWRGRERRARDRAPLLIEPGPLGDDRLDPLWDALAKLRPERRVALVLRYYGQLTSVEIAEVLGCPAATVRTRLHRGLADLRKEIER